MTLHLCATSRLTQFLRARPPAPGAAVWPTCRALTVNAWLEQVVEEAVLSGTAAPLAALDSQAERLLWEQVIADSLDGAAAPLFDLTGLAAAAAEANALCELWQILPGDGPLADETRLFLAWRREFRRRAAPRGWREAARLPAVAVDLIEKGDVPLPAAVRFAGFDRYTPLEKRLYAALQARGVEVSPLPAGRGREGEARTRACPDLAAECRAVAAWASRLRAADPAARLGVVVPDLAAVRDALAFVLDDAFHPEACRPAGAEAPRCYNLSLGTPLAGESPVRTALALLALAATRQHEQSAISALLLDPGWSAGQAEADSRARIDAAMRRELEYFTDLPALVRLAKRLFARDQLPCPQLVRHLEAYGAAQAAAGSRRRPPSAWAGLFREWLESLGWPGDRPLSSREYQARQAFLETLASLARFDDLLGGIRVDEACRRLARLCGERIFQPETRGRPAIEIVGVLESTGLEFDALWVMGMNDHAWPPPPRPNPLLPADLQRRAGSPHASAEVELAFATAVHRRLLQAAPDITFSYSQADGNRMLRPSPLLAGIAAAPGGAVPPPGAAPARLERVADAVAPAVAPGEKVSGGTGLLKAQAICPAWGYFRYRLGAEALGEAVEGLDATARGTLVHGALEHFWGAAGSLEGLLALDQSALNAAIAGAVAAALDAFEATSHRQLPPRFRRLEAERLKRLLAVWLDFEMTRFPGFTVAACEREAILDLAGIRVRTVIDRIDRLDDGRYLILDYKTGQNIDTRNWAEARITEPQLPIYAAIAVPQEGDGPVAGVAFAKVVADAPAFAGIADSKGLLPGVAGLDDDKRKLFPAAAFPDWNAVLAHWHARLHAIAEEIRAGDAGVRFADESALRYCDVLPLLRLPERRQQLEAQS